MLTVHSTELVRACKPSGGRFIDLTDAKFDRLTVTGYAGYKVKPCGKRSHYWWCRCSCGKGSLLVARTDLVALDTGSCGCLRVEVTGAKNRTHGESKRSREYSIWANMLTRCRNENNEAYPDYGGRGITVCDRWLVFENFLADMGRAPSRRHSLDRLDNDKGYEPDNCAWRTQKQQCRNRRSNHVVTYDGKSQCVAAWAEELGIEYGTLLYRLRRWTVEAALATPMLR